MGYDFAIGRREASSNGHFASTTFSLPQNPVPAEQELSANATERDSLRAVFGSLADVPGAALTYTLGPFPARYRDRLLQSNPEDEKTAEGLSRPDAVSAAFVNRRENNVYAYVLPEAVESFANDFGVSQQSSQSYHAASVLAQKAILSNPDLAEDIDEAGQQVVGDAASAQIAPEAFFLDQFVAILNRANPSTAPNEPRPPEDENEVLNITEQSLGEALGELGSRVNDNQARIDAFIQGLKVFYNQAPQSYGLAGGGVDIRRLYTDYTNAVALQSNGAFDGNTLRRTIAEEARDDLTQAAQQKIENARDEPASFDWRNIKDWLDARIPNWLQG